MIDQIREHYDRLSPLYAKYWGPHIHHGYWRGGESTEQAQIQLMDELARAARISKGASVLDVGCGFGGSSLWLAEKLNCQVLGITLSPVQATAARREAIKRKLDHLVTFDVVDANQLSFPSIRFDVIWIVECSEHLFDKALFFKRCAQILKPGGVIGVCTWLEGKAASEPESRVIIEKIKRAMICPSFGSFQDYKQWFAQSGLEIIEAKDITANVLPTWSNCLKILKRPEIRAFLFMSDKATKEFAGSFELMKTGFERGAMMYGLFSARKT